MWIHGDGDLIVSDRSMFDAGTLGSMDVLPEWPGDEVDPPQPMEAQTRAVLADYAAAGGSTREEVVVDSSHGPFIDHLDDLRAPDLRVRHGVLTRASAVTRRTSTRTHAVDRPCARVTRCSDTA